MQKLLPISFTPQAYYYKSNKSSLHCKNSQHTSQIISIYLTNFIRIFSLNKNDFFIEYIAKTEYE